MHKTIIKLQGMKYGQNMKYGGHIKAYKLLKKREGTPEFEYKKKEKKTGRES